jgi:dolichol-phosphate mannosyltransferase
MSTHLAEKPGAIRVWGLRILGRDLASVPAGCQRLCTLGWHRLARPVRFGLVGLSGMAMDLGAFALLGSCLPLAGARASAIALAMIWNFLLNRRLTFAACHTEKPWWMQLPMFCVACLSGALSNWSVSVVLCRASAWFDGHRSLAAAVGVASGFVLNYLCCKLFVFRPSRRPC